MKHISSNFNSACAKCGKRRELWEEELLDGKRIGLCAKCISSWFASVMKSPKESQTEGIYKA